MAESADEVIECHGRIADHIPMGWARRGVQGVSLAWREEVGEDSTRVGIRDDEFPLEVLAEERGDHNVQGAAAVQSLQSRPEPSRQVLQAGIIDLRLQLCFAWAMVDF
jgi:hypothetical protein